MECYFFDNINKSSIVKNDIIKLKNKPKCKSIFIGDGLSDFRVIGKVDYLLCKKDSLLHNKCIIENCEHVIYNNFNDILIYLKKLLLFD
jgi:2-hydroxy-3-keto-5-methylthiopentenyl-1-phosphate phosphatase